MIGGYLLSTKVFRASKTGKPLEKANRRIINYDKLTVTDTAQQLNRVRAHQVIQDR